MRGSSCLRAGLAVALAGFLPGCRGGPPQASRIFRPEARGREVASAVSSDGVTHAGFPTAAGAAFEWTLPPGARGRLRLAWSAPGAAGPVSLEALLAPPDGSGKAAAVARWTRANPAAAATVFWSEDAPLPRGASGRRLRLRTDPAAKFFLSDPRIVVPDDRAPAVVLLVFDTTRRDAVSFGGCPDPSSPALDAVLRGAWIAPRAYAPASWTIPSMAAMLTGRVPAVHEDASGSPLGIAPDVATLAEDFRGAGWSTAAFVANPTLRPEVGFAAGFTTFFSTPYEGPSITLPGRETVRRVPGWLGAHRGEPFLLWIHVMDPHDPYTPFDRPRGETPFDPGYRGAIVGDEVNRLQLGDPPPAAPADVRHLQALYHDEVRLADADFAALWNGQPRAERERWTFVFTSDHGEEFGEHGGWKHGPSLYDEVLRVPLAIRPGAGRKLPPAPADALVSLLDVLPTVEGLAGLARPARPLDGIDLFAPNAAPREALPAVTMLTGGAARGAVVSARGKLHFFDRLGTRGTPDAAKDPNGYRLARRLPSILPGLARFDLAADPAETRPLAAAGGRFARDWEAIERAIAHTRRGIEVRALGASPVALRVEGLGAKSSAEEFGLEEDDRLAVSAGRAGTSAAARLDPSDGVDGFRLEDASAGDLRIVLESGCARLRLPGARPVPLAAGAAQRVPRAAIPAEVPRFETAGECTDLYLWKAVPRGPVRSPAEQDEAVRKLRALGYLH